MVRNQTLDGRKTNVQMLALNNVSEDRKGAASNRNMLTAAAGTFFVPIGR